MKDSKKKKKQLVSKEALLNPVEILDRAIASGLETGYSDIDDGAIKKAPNVFEWLTGPSYLNEKPFAKQLQDALFAFNGFCFFCSNMPYMVDVPVDASISNIRENCQLIRYSKCPKCKRGVHEMRYEWCLDPSNTYEGYIKTDPPNELCIISGQRSGKSIAAAMYSTYILHLYLKLPNPSKWFGLLKRQVLYGTFCAVTSTQAWENMWQPFSDLIDSSPWFTAYHKFLDEKSEEIGDEIWTKKDTYLWYGHKRLALSFAPSDVRSLRGRTRFLAGIDEFGWYGTTLAKSSKIRADGDGTHRALNNSLSTIRNKAVKKRKYKPKTPDAYMLTISSPSAATDPIMRRSYKAHKLSRMYFVRRSTWEANPNFTEESLRAQEGDATDIAFMCDYGAVPPYSDAPWWDSEDHLMGLCRKDQMEQKLFTYSIHSEMDPSGQWEWIWSKVKVRFTDKTLGRILTFDNGEKVCSFSWGLGRYEPGNEDLNGTVIAEQFGEVAPDKGQRIHLGKMWEFTILPLIESFNLLHVVWDRWESSTYVSTLRTEYKIRAEQYSASRADAKGLKSDMRNGLVSLPMPEVSIGELPIGVNQLLAMWPNSHLLLQIMTVRDFGGMPQKPQGGNDDTFRCLLLMDAIVRANEEEYGLWSITRQNREQISSDPVIGIGPKGVRVRRVHVNSSVRKIENPITGGVTAISSVGGRNSSTFRPI